MSKTSNSNSTLKEDSGALTITEEPAAAAEDPAVTARRQVSDLMRELAGIDELIREAEVAATRQTDESALTEALAELRRVQARKESLPFLLRGAQARILRAKAAALGTETAAAKVKLDEANAAFDDATSRHVGLAHQASEIVHALRVAKNQQEQLEKQYNELYRDSMMAETDASRIEQGLEPFEHKNYFAEPD